MAKTDSKETAFPRKEVVVRSGKDEVETARNFAEMLTSPELAAYRVINQSEQNTGLAEPIDVPTLMAFLREQTEAIKSGDLSNAEAMLMNQATALQSLFSRLAERGMAAETVPSFESNMKLALKAQSQCRATLEAISSMKNPPTVFAKQANVTTGPQQVNNGPPMSSPLENQKPPNELSGEIDELLENTRTQKETCGDDPQMEAVGEINRAKNGGR